MFLSYCNWYDFNGLPVLITLVAVMVIAYLIAKHSELRVFLVIAIGCMIGILVMGYMAIGSEAATIWETTDATVEHKGEHWIACDTDLGVTVYIRSEDQINEGDTVTIKVGYLDDGIKKKASLVSVTKHDTRSTGYEEEEESYL